MCIAIGKPIGVDVPNDEILTNCFNNNPDGAGFAFNYNNEVVIKKSTIHAPSEVLSGHNDHRIVMSLAVLCTLFGGTISGCEAVNKSYPEFFDDLRILGISWEKTNENN